MDLSLSISSALRLLGDASKTQHVTFQEVLHKVAQDLKFESKSNTITPEAHVIDGGVVTHCHAALSTLFVESVRGGHNTSVLTSTLEDLNWPPERITEALRELESCRHLIHSRLASLGTYPPHIVDVDWKLYYQVRSSAGQEGGGAMYLVTLHTEESEGKRGKVTFSCSLAQLTHLVTRLRQATRCIQKYANSS
ncbi:COMM domain-containing protein 3 [Procambarus clarkii]|uniref:COMM domain-containing protein 3 n=1 Tax=Procambarus clarkii TaxID=6728 RepID=UPI001E67386C|nr:COMM domain-containing protein 3-like [Procambarus clarkii]